MQFIKKETGNKKQVDGGGNIETSKEFFLNDKIMLYTNTFL